MISFSCPGCQATFKLPDEMAGKTARCSKCNHRFTVPGDKPKPAAAPTVAPAPMSGKPAVPAKAQAPLPAKKVPLTPVSEVLEAEVIDEPAPGRPAKPAGALDEVEVVDEVQVVDDAAIQAPPRAATGLASSGRARADRDLDNDDRPRRRGMDDDWGDDDDLAGPRRTKRHARSGGSMGIIMASIGGGSFLLMIVVGIAMAMTAGPRPVVVNNAPPFQVNFNPQPMQPNFGQPNPPPPNAGPGEAIKLVNGVFETNGELTQQDAMDNVGQNFFRQGARAKRYSCEMVAGKTYTIDMIRTNQQQLFDPFLRLEQNGTTLLEDDDSGGNLNSRIVYRPQQTGAFTIVATSLGQHFGSYRLSVRATP